MLNRQLSVTSFSSSFETSQQRICSTIFLCSVFNHLQYVKYTNEGNITKPCVENRYCFNCSGCIVAGAIMLRRFFDHWLDELFAHFDFFFGIQGEYLLVDPRQLFSHFRSIQYGYIALLTSGCYVKR